MMSFHFKGHQGETQKELVFQFKCKGRKKVMALFKGCKKDFYLGEGQPFCSIQAFDWLDEAHTLYKGHPAFLKVHWFQCEPHPKTPHRDTQNVWSTMWASCNPVNLTYKINHHNWGLFVFHIRKGISLGVANGLETGESGSARGGKLSLQDNCLRAQVPAAICRMCQDFGFSLASTV